MERKINFFKDKIDVIEEHFQVLLNDKTWKIDALSIDGIFIINTPTFIMYNNDFRIYTLKSFEDIVTGNHEDLEFQLLIDDGGQQTMLSVKYPYFKKPTCLVFNVEEDEESSVL
jgi:hypothetical protein